MNPALPSFGKSLSELLSSMRFAISLLSILAVASIIGTVLKQAEPYNNYIIQLGPFWFRVYEKPGLYDVYHAAWFLLILTFLVASTSVCITRNAPNFAREMKSFREHVSKQSLNAFKHKHEVTTTQTPETLAASAQRYLDGQGYKVKNLPRGDGVLLAAKAGKKIRDATIAVNHPLIHDDIAIYQASFADGGTRLTLRGWNLFAPTAQSFDVDGTVRRNTTLTSAAGNYTLEFTDFRPFNIENMGGEGAAAGDTMSVLGGSPVSNKKHLRNVGPSFQFKLRDARGQAREFSNYMLPLQLDGRWFMMSGVRESPNEAFRYLRMPLDAGGSIDSFMRLRGALLNDCVRKSLPASPARHCRKTPGAPRSRAS